MKKTTSKIRKPNGAKPIVSRRFICPKNERKFNDAKVAKLIASKCYNPTISDEDFAVQIFVEALVLPKDVEAYGEETMCQYLKKFMKSHKNGG